MTAGCAHTVLRWHSSPWAAAGGKPVVRAGGSIGFRLANVLQILFFQILVSQGSWVSASWAAVQRAGGLTGGSHLMVAVPIEVQLSHVGQPTCCMDAGGSCSKHASSGGVRQMCMCTYELYRPRNKILPVLSALLSQKSSLPGQFIIRKLKVVPSSWNLVHKMIC